MPHSRTTAVVAAALAAAAGLSACTGSTDKKPDPKETARSYADVLSSMLAGNAVPPGMTGATQAELTRIVKGMGASKHDIKVADVSVPDGGTTGTVTLEHAWTVRPGAAPWTYRTTVPITRTGDEWHSTWAITDLVADLKPGERIGATRLPATRADILGDGGSPLVTARPVARVGIDRAHAASAEVAGQSAAKLAALVGIDAAAFTKQVTAAGPQAFVEAIVYRDPSPDLSRVTPQLAGIPGASAVKATMPLAPTSSFAAPVLGRVGLATAEIVDASHGAVRAGDVVGLSGLEQSANATLSGTPGYVVQAFGPSDATQPRDLFTAPAKNGTPVATTLSMAHQDAAEKALAGLAPASAIVAIRPSDGHLLAVASGPGSKGYSTATLGQYAPGSTFKTVTSLALLRSGMTPTTPVACTPTLVVDGRTFTNYDAYAAADLGTIPLTKALAHSCNTAFISSRDKLAGTALEDAAAGLGLTTAPAIGIPAAGGVVPASNGSTDAAAATIGQGRVVASPLAMATVAASIAAGHPVIPMLVTTPGAATGAGSTGTASAGSSAPAATTSATTPAPPAHPVTPAEAEQLRTMMRAVVTEGSAPFLQKVPGAPVTAKTGTAEYGNDTPPKTHAWMIAVQGDLAVAVFVDDGIGGAKTAGPVLTQFLDAVATKG